MKSNQTMRPVAIVGGVRTPFCRSNTAYTAVSNQQMLTAAIQGLVDQFSLQGQKIDEVFAGAVVTHAADWNLARECVLSTGLSPRTPATTIQQACGTGLQGALMAAAKIASGQIDSAVAGGSDTTSDASIVFARKFSRRMIAMNSAKTFAQRMKALKGFGLGELMPQAPANGEPRTGLSMGDHCELMAKQWEIDRSSQDELAALSHQNAAAAYDEGFFDDLIVPFNGVSRDNNLRPESSAEALSKLRPAYDKKSGHGTLTAGNSTPLTDGASAVLLATEEWARERGLPVLAYLTVGRTAANDFVNGDGLLMAPTIAIADMLKMQALRLQDFDFYEIHEAFAAQVLCTLKAFESESYCKEHLGLDAALGSIDRSKLNVKGSSLAVGHPFAATGGRVLSVLAKLLAAKGNGRGLISVCTAGGMGVAAIVER